MTWLTLSVVNAIYLLASMVFFGRKLSKYSHVRNTISELGEAGSAHSGQVSFGLFLVVGILQSVIAIVFYLDNNQNEMNAIAWQLSACVAAGYIVAAFFPCDPGSPAFGSARQGIHNLGGAIEYFGSGIVMANSTASIPYLSQLGLIVLVGGVALSFTFPFRGFVQRIIELILFTVICFSVFKTI